MSNAPSTQNNAQPIHSFWRISVVYFGSNGQTISKSMTTKETLLPLPQKTTPTLVTFLKGLELQELDGITPDEYLHLWDLALGYTFWANKQEEIQCLRNCPPNHPNTQL